MAVHAHPDDEATGTGGILARYAAEGVRTVLVTCTDGRCGDGAGGAKPGEAGHHPAEVVEMRSAELRQACDILGVSALAQLGYHDSGMMGWPSNEAPGAFWAMDPIEAARPLIDLMRQYRPQVVVTYDANGFYGHPDHIMAHRIAMIAAAASGIPKKVYYTAVPRSGMASFTDALRAAGIDVPGVSDREEGRFAAPEDGDQPVFGTPDSLITSTIDVGGCTAVKRQALAAHSSQADNIFFLRLDDDLFKRIFGTESFVRAVDRTDAAVPETDLFAGLRPA
jgi:LmbE family N-acetylglucosaminyl deacetylase